MFIVGKEKCILKWIIFKKQNQNLSVNQITEMENDSLLDGFKNWIKDKVTLNLAFLRNSNHIYDTEPDSPCFEYF